MSPLDPADVQGYYGQQGKFMSIRDIEAGKSVVVTIQDIS